MWNAFMVYCSYVLSRITGSPIHVGMPVSLTIEPTTSCNLRCPECPSGRRSFTRPAGRIDFEHFQDFVDQLSRHITYLNLYFQGEPYLHPEFFRLVKYSHEKNIYTATSTNAHFLSSEFAKETVLSGLNRLFISLDGLDQETYASYRVGGELNKVIDGIRQVMYWKKKLRSKTPYVILQFLVFKTNEHQIEEVKSFGKEMGVDQVQIKSAQFYDFEEGNPLMTGIQKHARYRKTANGSYTIKSKLPKHCWRMWSSAVITWDGKVLPCCFDKDAGHLLGSLEEDGFGKIWKGKPYRAFRKAVFSNRGQIDICKNCTEGLKHT